MGRIVLFYVRAHGWSDGVAAALMCSVGVMQRIEEKAENEETKTFWKLILSALVEATHLPTYSL